MTERMVDTQRLRDEAHLLRFRAVMCSDDPAAASINSAADLLEEIAVDIERAASLSQPRKSQEAGKLAVARRWIGRLF